jgi:DMSO/TMAO reductase YedYZ heme-binding membrane subunit
LIALTTPVLWYLSRASGIVSLILFTVVMAFGILTATRVGGRSLPRFAVAELHRRLSLLAVVFLAIHVASTVLDTYVNVGIISVFVPGTSHYKTLYVALGTVALDLMVAVAITSLLRQRISHSAWRAIHWVAYLAWPIALIHAIFIGTDLRFGWMDILVGACVVTVLAAVAWRLWAHPHPDGALTAVPKRTAPRGSGSGSGSAMTPARQSAPERPRPVASTRQRPR